MEFGYLDNLLDEIGEAEDFNSFNIKDLENDNRNIPLDQLCTGFFEAVKYLNDLAGKKIILIDLLSAEICKLLLNPDHHNGCFYLTSTKKYVFIFEQYPGQIVFLGKYAKRADNYSNTNRNFIQLFILNYEYRDNALEFKDNTGNGLRTEEVIYQILRWLLSP